MTPEEMLEWGAFYEAKQTELEAGHGHICQVCDKDAGERPVRVSFKKKGDAHFHRECTKLIKNDYESL